MKHRGQDHKWQGRPNMAWQNLVCLKCKRRSQCSSQQNILTDIVRRKHVTSFVRDHLTLIQSMYRTCRRWLRRLLLMWQEKTRPIRIHKYTFGLPLWENLACNFHIIKYHRCDRVVTIGGLSLKVLVARRNSGPPTFINWDLLKEAHFNICL